MAAGVSIRGAKGVRRMLDDAEFGPWTRRALLRSGFLVQANAATVQILRGGGFDSPNIKTLSVDPKQITSRHGGAGIVGSIAVDRSELPRYAVEVGSGLAYAGVHEFGNATTPARPYLEPALEAESGEFPGIFMQEWDRDMAEHRGQVGP